MPRCDENGVIHERRPRSTGLPVQQLDAEVAVDFKPEEGGRYVTLCVEHGEFVQHETFALARHHTANPEGWCSQCAALVDGNGKAAEKESFTEEDRRRAAEARSRNAAERRAEEEKRRAEAEAAKKAGAVWQAWTVYQPPFIVRRYEEEEQTERRALLEKARQWRAEAATAAHEQRRLEDRDADPKQKPLTKKEHARMEELEATAVERRANAAAARREADLIARRAWIRGAAEKGYSVEDGGAVLYLSGHSRRIRIPDDFLPRAELLGVSSAGHPITTTEGAVDGGST